MSRGSFIVGRENNAATHRCQIGKKGDRRKWDRIERADKAEEQKADHLTRYVSSIGPCQVLPNLLNRRLAKDVDIM